MNSYKPFSGGVFLLSLLIYSSVFVPISDPLFPQTESENFESNEEEHKEESDEETAGPEVNFRGYLENTTRGEYLKSTHKDRLYNNTRLRLNLSGAYQETLDYAAGIVANRNSGAKNLSLLDYLPEKDLKRIHPLAADFFSVEIEDDIYVQEAFIGLFLGRFNLRLGRQKFYTGVGYAFNPIDLFNTKNPQDPTYEIDGLDAVLGTLQLGDASELQLMARFAGDSSESTDYLARFKTNFFDWDLALQFTRVTRSRVDFSALNNERNIQKLLTGAAQEKDFAYSFRWNFAGLEATGEIFGVNFYLEGGYAWIKNLNNSGEGTTLEKQAGQDHARGLIGFDYTFDFELSVQFEYLYLGQIGETPHSFNSRMAYMSGEILSLNRDTLVAGASYNLTDLLDVSLYIIGGLNDNSALINPWFNYKILPGCNLALSIYFPQGREDSANGRTGAQGFFRIKYNF